MEWKEKSYFFFSQEARTKETSPEISPVKTAKPRKQKSEGALKLQILKENVMKMVI